MVINRDIIDKVRERLFLIPSIFQNILFILQQPLN